MFEQTTTLTNEVTKVLRGENKPTIVFEFSYQNIIFILIGVIFSMVISNLIVNSLTK
jgi:hypothetical protein